ncbi:MAG: selenide, water dikinase SelD [Methylophilaceae bacterium]
MNKIRLTEYSHGGGCGCKIAPAMLTQMLAKLPPLSGFSDLLVGIDSSDDAAVYRLNDTQAIVATTDFFMPIVDDPYDFGRIAATNALSDIYAMGAKPIFALAVVGMPINKLPMEVIQNIMLGGASVCQAAGIPIAGGHSIDSPEPIYGLVAIGLIHPDQVKRNNQAKDGDALILSKPIGIGVLSAALKKGTLSAEGYQQMLAITTQLNQTGTLLSAMSGVNAVTDVTGFALLGHLLEICRGSALAAEIEFSKVPCIDVALKLAQEGYATGAAERNWDSYGAQVTLGGSITEWQRKFLCDPQTSGGLLVSCSPESADAVLKAFYDDNFKQAAIIGKMHSGDAMVTVR